MRSFLDDAVYLYFGHTILTNGSYEDLHRVEITPREGLQLTFYDFDADEQNNPTYLCANGVLYSEDGMWHARVDESSFRSVPRNTDAV